MTHFVTDSEIVQSTSNKNHHIFETEFMAPESFFDNTAFFHITYGMLHFNPDSGNPLVLLFSALVSSFPLGFFLGMHISTPSGLCPMKPVSYQSLIPLGSRRGSSSQIFLSYT